MKNNVDVVDETDKHVSEIKKQVYPYPYGASESLTWQIDGVIDVTLAFEANVSEILLAHTDGGDFATALKNLFENLLGGVLR